MPIKLKRRYTYCMVFCILHHVPTDARCGIDQEALWFRYHCLVSSTCLPRKGHAVWDREFVNLAFDRSLTESRGMDVSDNWQDIKAVMLNMRIFLGAHFQP